MHSLLIKAWNYALDQLSKIKVPGLPDFEEDRQIVFVRSDGRCIATEACLQGPYKPDIVLVKWSTFKAMQKKQEPYSISYLSDVCCKSGCDQPKFNWRNLLSMVEVERGCRTPGGVNERFPKITFTSGFEDLRAEATTAEPLTPSPPAQPDGARE